MFEHLVAEEAQFDKQLVDFIELYARFRKDALDPKADRVRMARFAARIDADWLKIPESKREVLVRALLAKELLPDEVEAALRIFNARVVSL